ncbi:MAG: cell division protein FtsQ/DivIB [Desulforhopalus sp.]
MPLRSIPGQGGRYQSRNGRLARIRQRLQRRKMSRQTGYRPPSSKKFFGGLTGAAIIGFVLLVVGILAGTDKIMGELQSVAFFKVADITCDGCEIVSKDRLREISGLIMHQTSLIGLNTASVEKKLLAIPWVAHAKVAKNWPSAIAITISENKPVALLYMQQQGKAALHYIDQEGVPFLEVSPGGYIDFPVITGISEIRDSDVQNAAFAEVLIFLKKLRRNDPYLPAQSVSEIHLTADGEMVVYLVEYPFPIFFGNGNTKRKYARLIEVLKELYKKEKGKELISSVEYIQMEYFDDKVLVAQGGSG